MIAHMLDKYFVLFIFIPGEDNGIRKSDNLISRSVSNRFRTIFRVQDYYKTNIQLSGIEISSFIEELKEIRKKSPYSKEIERIVNCINQQNISKIRITGD